MSGILDLLKGPIGQQIISGVSAQTGQSTDKTSGLLSMAMPVLMGAMQRNASTPEGAAGLLGALTGSKHGGGILDNLSGFFDGGVEDSVTNDGAGILGHILGNKQAAVENALSQKSGMDTGSVNNMLKVAAPLLMGVLGKQASQDNVTDTNGLSSMLGSMLGGGAGSKQQSLIESFLDADGDGSILDDVAGMVLGEDEKSGGLGGLIGGLFGK